MTTHYDSPASGYDPDFHDDPTLARPHLSFGRPAERTALGIDATSSKSGWLVSGVAAVLAIAALSVVGGIAFETLGTSAPAANTVSVPAPPAPRSAVSVAAPAPAAPAPVVTVSQSAPTVVVTRPAPAPAPVAPVEASPAPVSPVDTPPEPAPPPWHPGSGGIKICDIVKCDPPPPAHPNPLPTCGDFAACTPRPAP
jgi:hypothetical protein